MIIWLIALPSVSNRRERDFQARLTVAIPTRSDARYRPRYGAQEMTKPLRNRTDHTGVLPCKQRSAYRQGGGVGVSPSPDSYISIPGCF